MLRKFSFILLILISSGSLFAQNAGGIITGVVVDSLTRSPIELANFRIISKKDTSRIFGAATDKSGRFVVRNIPFDSYSARVSSVGYKSRKRNLVVLSAKVRLIDLDTIYLAQRDIVLGEVEVIEKQEEIVQEKEKIILRVSREMGDNGLEILENIPMLSVDIDGNVSLFGSDKTAVYIDGLPISAYGFQKTEDLRMFSSSMIEKVEIITNPSIEYYDAGETGVINIVTKKKIDQKYTGNLSAGGNTRRRLNLDAAIISNFNDVMTRGSYNFSNSNADGSSGFQKTININDTAGYQKQTSNYNNESTMNRGSVSINYNPDDQNRIFGSFSLNNRISRNNQKKLSELNSAGRSDLLNSNNDKNIHQQFVNFSVSYSKSFNGKKSRLSSFLSYMENFMNLEDNISYENSAATVNPEIQYTSSENKNNNWRWKVSYYNSINENISYSFLNSTDYSRLTLNDNYYNYINGIPVENKSNGVDYATGIFQNNLSGELRCSVFNFDLNLSAGYNIYATSWEDKLSVNSFSKRFSNIVVSASVQKQITQEQKFDLKYNRHYGYPQNRNLNPYSDISDSTNIVVGNPDLQPFHIDLYAAGYSYFNNNYYLRGNFSVSKYKNGIEAIATQETVSKSVTTYKNLSNSNHYSVGFYASRYKLFDFLNISSIISYSWHEFVGSNINSKGSSWDSQVNVSASFKNLKLQFLCWYSSPSTSAQSRSRDQYSADAGVKMLFFDQALSVTFKARDLFNTLNQNSISFGYGYSAVNYDRTPTQIFSINIAYYFQSKAKEDIEEDKDSDEYVDDF